jgi:SEC-C motif-containing protein
VHEGRPASPPELVRARYVAYVLGKLRFLMDTTHPSSPHVRADRAAWRAELAEYCKRARLRGLEIHAHELDEARGEAFVTFTVAMQLDDRDASFGERSRFLREGNRWLYVSGEQGPPAPGS